MGSKRSLPIQVDCRIEHRRVPNHCESAAQMSVAECPRSQQLSMAQPSIARIAPPTPMSGHEHHVCSAKVSRLEGTQHMLECGLLQRIKLTRLLLQDGVRD